MSIESVRNHYIEEQQKSYDRIAMLHAEASKRAELIARQAAEIQLLQAELARLKDVSREPAPISYSHVRGYSGGD